MRALILSVVLSVHLPGAARWVRLTSPHFEFYTSGSVDDARKAVQRLEDLYEFFRLIPYFSQKRMLPARFVQFSNSAQFTEYRSVEWEAGHYEFNGSRDWIALGPETSESTLAHEYVHLLVTRSGLRPAPWLNEGIAELFSTVRGIGDRTIVGDLPSSSMKTLAARDWMPIETLTEIGDGEYQKMSLHAAHLFYPQSWILTHMLFLGPEYSPRFTDLLFAIGRGKTTGEAFHVVYGRPVSEIAKELVEYWNATPKRAKSFSHRFGETAVTIEDELVSPFEASLVLADLCAVMGKADRTKRAFAALDTDFSAVEQIKAAGPRRAAQLAAMYFHLARYAAAPFTSTLTGVFELPEVRKTTPGQAAATAELFYEYAMAAREAKQPTDKVVSALSVALDLQPDYLKARSQLGHVYLDLKDLTAAQSTFERIPRGSEASGSALNGFCGIATAYIDAKRFDDAAGVVSKGREWAVSDSDVKQANAAALYIGQTASRFYLNAGNLVEAGKHASDAREYATDRVDVQELDRIIELVAGRSKGQFAAQRGESLKRMRGITQALECTQKGGLLKLSVEGKAVLLDLPGPEAVEVTGSTTSIELRCGALEKMPVTVEYAPPGILNQSSLGVIRRMEF